MEPGPLSLLLPRATSNGDDQSELARAIALAALAHAQQIDKSGRPYILHPLRVMEQCREHGITEQIVAVLHDVVEDTWVTLEHLQRLGFAPEVVTAVDAISRRPSEDYFEYIDRCGANRISAVVKLADLDDNSDPRRRFGSNFEHLMRRYEQARRMITASLLG